MNQLSTAITELKEAVTQVIGAKAFSLSDRRLIRSVAAIAPAADADTKAAVKAAREAMVDIEEMWHGGM